MPVLLQRYLPAIVIMVALLMGGGMTATVLLLESRAVDARLDRMADQVAARLQERIHQHIALLEATQSYFEALDGRISALEFANYVGSLDLADAYGGIQGIGLARLMPAERVAEAEREIREKYDVATRVRPASDLPLLTPIVMLHPQDSRNREALGFDMFSEPRRREAMTAAVRRNGAAGTAPVELVQEITATKQAGFLVYLPARTSRAHQLPPPFTGVSGFIYAPFRAGDLHMAVLRRELPVAVRTVDVAAPEMPLYDDFPARAEPGGRRVDREVDVSGRRWRVTVAAAEGFSQPTDHLTSIFMGAMSLLLAVAVAGSLRSYSRSVAEAERAARLSARMADDRTLMLREMQHRIKNHIARILAIARQTSRGSADLADFNRVFAGRLQAMAAAQDLVSGDAGDSVDLRALVQGEIGQLMDADRTAAIMSGPALRLNGRQAQAVGLVIHELATNSMKYGGEDGLDDLCIRWERRAGRDGDWLQLTWTETIVTPEGPLRRGFGTELMETMIEGDLQGRLSREFTAGGLQVEIAFPLRSADEG